MKTKPSRSREPAGAQPGHFTGRRGHGVPLRPVSMLGRSYAMALACAARGAGEFLERWPTPKRQW